MAVKCSACGETSARHEVARPEYDPIAPQIVGGILMALVFSLSRKRRFRCDRCGELLLTHYRFPSLARILGSVFGVAGPRYIGYPDGPICPL
jgi:hypothetical protein